MTGYDVYKKACALLGYSLTESVASDRRSKRMPDVLSQIGADLKVEIPESLSGEIVIEARKKEAFIYGAAMMLAVTENDSGHTRMFAELYNAKRASALCAKDSVTDTLPTAFDGGA